MPTVSIPVVRLESPLLHSLTLDGIARRLFELAMAFAMLALVIAPIHQRATHHLNVEVSIDGQAEASFALIREQGIAGMLSPGREIPIYRFNTHWRKPIGFARVESVSNDTARLKFDPVSFTWPMGRQARVLRWLDPEHAIIPLGISAGLKVGDKLNLFQGRIAAGQAEIQEIGPAELIARVTTPDLVPSSDLMASEFNVPTTAVYFEGGLYSTLEIGLILTIFAGWLWAVFTGNHLFGGIRSAVLPLISPAKSLRLKACLDVATGFVVGWITLTFFCEMARHLVQRWFGLALPLTPGGYSGLVFVAPALAWSAYYSLTRKRSFALAIRDRFRYRPLAAEPRIGKLTLNRQALIWAFHLLIAYAFGHTLHGFLLGNLKTILNTAWPGGHLSLDAWEQTQAAFRYLLSHSPQVASLDALWTLLRYTLWCLTILGCLLGYGYSIVSPLWNKNIRNLDFTVLGWITNSACYPLLGGVIWGLAPTFLGTGPTITEGPAHGFIQGVELLLNLLYTLSIWNMGTRFGVMADKGLVNSAFFRVVRHPSYTLESFMFVMMEMAAFSSPTNWLGALGHFLLPYYFRAEREDHFMSVSNPDYKDYKREVPYKFLPGLI